MCKLTKNLISLTFATILIVVMSGPTFSESMKIKGVNVQYYTNIDIEEVGDVENHFKGSYTTNGISIHGKEKYSTHHSKGTFNYIDGVGTQEGHVYRTFDDGSIIVTRYEGQAIRKEDKQIGKGIFTCVRGSGKYKGVTCEGSYKTNYLDNEMTVTHWEGIMTLPDAEGKPDP